MRDKIKVNISDEQKAVKVPTGTRMLIRRCCIAVLQLEKFEGSAEVEVTLIDNAGIKAINADKRDINEVTDVLSFPLGENGVYDVNPVNGAKLLGDIVLSVEKAQQQAEEFGNTFQREVAYLTVHSMLHLLGYDHVNGGLEEVKMREHEAMVLAAIGMPRSNAYPDLQ